ncbi:MAG: hypothetical protein AABX10_05370 [Nanoarchaeota archaeon]
MRYESEEGYDNLYICELIPKEDGRFQICNENYAPKWIRHPKLPDRVFMNDIVKACLAEGERFEHKEAFLPQIVRGQAWGSIGSILTIAE